MITSPRSGRPGEAQEPDPVAAAVLAELGGADGITIHLREDRRHIQDRDVYVLRDTIRTRMNLEMACTDEIVAIALKVRPDEVTLVPEKRQELTTEGGLDLIGTDAATRPAVEKLKAAGLHVSLFIDPDSAQLDAAKRLGADAIEFQTASYSEATTPQQLAAELAKLRKATAHALELDLHPHMGHGLNYQNVAAIVRIHGVVELNIGHSIVSRAVFAGLEQAVRDMKRAMSEHFPHTRPAISARP